MDIHFWQLAIALVIFVWAFRQACGRMAPRMALAPLLFLASRWPVLLGWAVGALGFKPHRFNAQLDNWSLPFEQILHAQTEGSRLVVLETTAGEEILVVPDPKRLVEVIQASLKARRSAAGA